MAKSYVLYGFSGEDKVYHPVSNWIFSEETFTVLNVKDELRYMLDKNPDIKEAYIVDNIKCVHEGYRDILRDVKRPIETRVTFKDMVAHYGVKVY